ncbi:MAG: ribosomal protein, partial [Conexibacter sp.]|nr:ribosomal protein [Conexibacter sp.]
TDEVASRPGGQQAPAPTADDQTPDPASTIETPVADAVLGPDDAAPAAPAETPAEAVQPDETAGEPGAPEPGAAGAHSAKPE